MIYQTVIGLEVHVQLATKSKIFSGSPTAYGAEPNTQVSAVDIGLPGTLPVLNREVVNMAIRFGLAINAKINHTCVFARKNYFYPDLPKGYQISQHDKPIIGPGELMIDLPQGSHAIAIERAHLEEDAGKLLHTEFFDQSGIDLNRAGTPLLEVVSAPVMHNAKEAVTYLKTLHTLVRYLGICDGNMQEGSFRCDVNVSICPVGSKQLGTRTECKNLNSFRFVERAIHYEVERQTMLLESGQQVVQETRLYDPDKDETRALRSKEDAHDYRYFPDPDLLPVVLQQQQIDEIKKTLPELPRAKQARFIKVLKLNPETAMQIIADPLLANYFEQVLAHIDAPTLAANWLITEVAAHLNKHEISINRCPVTPKNLAAMLTRITDKTLSNHGAKVVFSALWEGADNVDHIIKQAGLKQLNDTDALLAMVKSVLQKFPDQAVELKAGKEKLMGFLVGQVMKLSKGKANPQEVSKLLKDCIQKG